MAPDIGPFGKCELNDESIVGHVDMHLEIDVATGAIDRDRNARTNALRVELQGCHRQDDGLNGFVDERGQLDVIGPSSVRGRDGE